MGYNRLGVVVLLIVGITFAAMIGCNRNEVEDGGGEMMEGYRLPSVGNDGGDCVEPGYELSSEQWIQRGDGLIYGEIREVSPALDIGWVPIPVEGGDIARIQEAEYCTEIQDGIRIRLGNIGGFMHEDEIPDVMDIYLGATVSGLFPGHAPRAEDEKLSWPGDEPVLTEGMIIGGLIYHNSLVDRWSFRPGLRLPIFEIGEGGLKFQEAESEICGEWPPVQELEGMTAEELQEHIDILEEELDLITAEEDRLWSAKSVADGEARFAVDWIGTCISDEYLEQRQQELMVECQVDIDCEVDHICERGGCIREE